MGDGAADGAGEGESGVEGEAAQLLGGLLDEGVDLGDRIGGRGRGHYVRCRGRNGERKEERRVLVKRWGCKRVESMLRRWCC